MGFFAVASAAAQWLPAWKFAGNAESGESARRSLWLNGAGIIALAAPLQFDRYLVSVSWGIQSVITLWFSRRYADEIWLRVKGVGVLLAAIAHLVFFEYFDARLTVPLWTIGHWTFTWLLSCFVFVALCAYGCGAMLVIRRGATREDSSLSAVLFVVGSALLLAIFASQWERFVAAWWWMGLAVIWWAVAMRVPAAGGMSVLIALALTGKFFIWDTAEFAIDHHWRSMRGIFFNRMVITGALTCGLTILALRVMAKKLSRLAAPVTNRCHTHRLETGATQPIRIGSKLLARREALKIPEGFRALSTIMAVAAMLVVTWTGVFEIVRVFHFEPWAKAHFADPRRAYGIMITAFLAIQSITTWLLLAHRRIAWAGYAMLLTGVVALKVMLFDTIAFALSNRWRILSGALTNRQFLIGMLVIATVFVAYARMKRLIGNVTSVLIAPRTTTTTLILGLLLIPWVPTFEIIRVFSFEPFRDSFANPKLAMHVALSISWSLNAIGFLAVGFMRRVAMTRYMGIGLFGMIVAKVFLVDLAHLELLYRVVSFLVVGVLLMLASWLYQRLSAMIEKPKPAESTT